MLSFSKYVFFSLESFKMCFHFQNLKLGFQWVLCLLCFLRLRKNKCVSRKPCKRRSDLILNGQMRVPNKQCYLENRLVREPCKRRTACTTTTMTTTKLFLMSGWGQFFQCFCRSKNYKTFILFNEYAAELVNFPIFRW